MSVRQHISHYIHIYFYLHFYNGIVKEVLKFSSEICALVCGFACAWESECMYGHACIWCLRARVYSSHKTSESNDILYACVVDFTSVYSVYLCLWFLVDLKWIGIENGFSLFLSMRRYVCLYICERDREIRCVHVNV